MESLGLSQKGVQFINKWRRRIKGATGWPRFIWGKWPLKHVCVIYPHLQKILTLKLILKNSNSVLYVKQQLELTRTKCDISSECCDMSFVYKSPTLKSANCMRGKLIWASRSVRNWPPPSELIDILLWVYISRGETVTTTNTQIIITILTTCCCWRIRRTLNIAHTFNNA